MIKLWFIVVLITSQCAMQREAERKRLESGTFGIRIDPPGPILMLPRGAELGFPAAQGDGGLAVAIFSREYPTFTVKYDTGCYTVAVSSMPMTDWRAK